MDLRSGNAFWPIKNGLLASYPVLNQNETCEVAVLGGGITGALVAYRMDREGAETILLDKRDVATGSTAASTSLLTMSVIAAGLIVDDYLGRQNPDAHIFRFGR